MGKILGYSIVGAIGFIVGCGFYYLGRFLGNILREDILGFLSAFFVNPEIRDMFISGVIGMVLAIVFAYLWVRGESY